MALTDQLHDPVLATLTHLVKGRDKLASLLSDFDIDTKEAETLPDSAFAWPEKRAFPIHSSEHAIMSRLYSEVTNNLPAHVTEAIKEACDIYGVDEALFAQEKTASVDDANVYLLPTLRKLPVRSAEQAKTAQAKLVSEYRKLSLGNRVDAAVRFMDKAAEYGVQPDPLLCKFAGHATSARDVTRDWLEARAAAAPEEHRQPYVKLADGLRRAPATITGREALMRLAETIGQLDKQAGLERHYDRRLPDPMLTVFSGTPQLPAIFNKTAGSCVDLNGKQIPLTRLASFPAAFYADILGEDITKDAGDGKGGVDPQKLATILATLPRDMKDAVARRM